MVPSRSIVVSICEFYRNYFGTAAELNQKSPFSCIVHFGPTDELHQTLRFEEDRSAAGNHLSDPGVICIYLRSCEAFRLAFTKCHGDGLVMSPDSMEKSQKACEFVTGSCIDPTSKQEVLPLRHVVRSPSHPECPVISANT